MIVLIGVLVSLNALGNALVYDDHRVILDNLSLSRPWDWYGLLMHDPFRPFVNVTYALDYAIWHGPSPFGFHLTNLLIHLANILLLYRAALALAADGAFARNRPKRPRAVAGVAAVLFAVHPVLAQAVGYVSARTELLCAMFLLIAFNAARSAMRDGPRRLWLVAIVSWMFAVASKEIAVMFPFALLVYDRLLSPADSKRRRRLWTLHLPLVGLTLVAAAVRLLVLITIEQGSEPMVRWRFGLVELDVFRRYLQLMFVPVGQTIFHAVDPIQSVLELRAITGMATAILFVTAIWRLRRDGVVSFGLAWFGLLLIPSAILVVLDRGEPMAEHRLYAASAGLFLAAGGIARVIEDRLSQVDSGLRKRVHYLGFLIVALLSIRAISRTIVWHRPVSLWLEATEHAPDHWLPRLALGEALHEEGRHEEAIRMFRESIALRPTRALAYVKLGECELEMGQLTDAQESFARARVLAPDSAEGPFGLGLVALRVRDSRVARAYFLETFQKDPGNVKMRRALAQLTEETDPAQTLRLCEEIQRLAPQTPGNDDCIIRNRERLRAAGAP